MNLTLGDVQTTALIPVAIKANETNRKNPRIKDEVAAEIIKTLGIDTKPFDKFMSQEGVIARTVMLDRMVKAFVAKNPASVIVNIGSGLDNRFSRFNEEMKNHSFRGWLFAKLMPKMNDRWATFEW